MNVSSPEAQTTDLDRLGDEIAELSAHLDAATARLFDNIARLQTQVEQLRPVKA